MEHRVKVKVPLKARGPCVLRLPLPLPHHRRSRPRRHPPCPPAPAYVPPAPPATARYEAPQPASPPIRAESGFATCANTRVGFWSGFHFGPCIGFATRGEIIGFDLELDVFAGGTVPTVDFLVPISIVIPIGARDDLWDGAYVRVGPQLGYSITTGKPSDGFFRLGGHVGFG